MRKLSFRWRESALLRAPRLYSYTGSGGKIIGRMFLAIVPGLAHVAQHRFSKVKWYCIVWLALLLAGLFLYGASIGLFLLGSAIGLHGWISADGVRVIAHDQRFSQRLAIFLLAAFCVWGIYRAVGSFVFHDVTGGYTSLDVSYQNVRAGDYLLARRSSAREERLSRGSMVLIPARALRAGHAPSWFGSGQYKMIGEIVGLPGETVQVTNGMFVVDEQRLNLEQYPVPRWLAARTASVNVPAKSYFITSEYRVYEHGLTLTESTISQVCILQASDIEAHAFMKWLPITRRGWLKEMK